MQVINRSPAYRNQYVHRRDSISVANLSTEEISKRMRLGLISAAEQDSDSDGDYEEWDDFEDDDSEEEQATAQAATDDQNQYRLAAGRRSSINLASISDHEYANAGASAMDISTESTESGGGGGVVIDGRPSLLQKTASVNISKQTIDEGDSSSDASTVDGNA